MTAIDRTDLPMTLEDGELEVRTLPLDGGFTVGWFRLPAGTDLRPAVVGLPDDLCPAPHWGYVIEGRLLMHTKDGTESYTAGQAFHWPAGHAPEAPEDCEYVDFSPTEEFEVVLRHLTGA
jgi:hypothetical protein